MHPVLQEIVQMARERVEQELRTSPESLGGWDPDAFEQEVRELTRGLGQSLLQEWAEVRRQQAQEQATFCGCGQRRHVEEYQSFWWLSTFGKLSLEVVTLSCPKGHGQDRPFQRLTGLECRGKSKALVRALTDFGAEKSFVQARCQLLEHYGVELGASSVRQVVEEEARRAEAFVAGRLKGAIAAYEQEPRRRPGEPLLIVESDGSMVRTGKLIPDPEGGVSPKRGLPKGRRETQWKEVRLSAVQRLEEEEKLYSAVLGSPQEVGEQMFALALLAGWGEETKVHGVGDAASWIAPQMAQEFPRCSYLLDRYHLLEHLYQGAEALPCGCAVGREEWVKQQVERIEKGEVEGVIQEARSLAGGEARHPLGQLAGFLERQGEHLDYASAREEGLPIGSGMVEGGHRHVIQERMKLPGAWWKEENVNPMVALRTLRENGWWEEFWN